MSVTPSTVTNLRHRSSCGKIEKCNMSYGKSSGLDTSLLDRPNLLTKLVNMTEAVSRMAVKELRDHEMGKKIEGIPLRCSSGVSPSYVSTLTVSSPEQAHRSCSSAVF